MVWKNILTGLKVLVVLFLTNLIMTVFYFLIGLLFYFGVLSLGNITAVMIVTLIIIILIMPVWLWLAGYWATKVKLFK